MRTCREARRAHVADDLLLPNPLPDMEPLRKLGEVPIPGPDAVRVPDFDQIAIPAIATSYHDDAVGGGAHGRPIPRRVIGPLVGSPAPENRMEAPAEPARDVAEEQGRAQERAAQRAATIVGEPPLAARAIEGDSE